MSVADIVRDQDELAGHIYDFSLWPRMWQTYNSIHNWQIEKFDLQGKNNIPDQPGIYSFLIQPGIANHPACSYLLYVGKAKSLRRRFGEYFNEKKRENGRPMILRMLNKYPNNLWFCFTIVHINSLISIENNLIKAYLPPLNKQIPAEISSVTGAF